MADKVLPQRVSATSVRVEGAELLEGGGLSMLPSQGSRGDEVVPVGRRIALGHILPAGHWCQTSQGESVYSSGVGGAVWGVHTLAKQDCEQTRSSRGLGWRPQEDPKPVLEVPS